MSTLALVIILRSSYVIINDVVGAASTEFDLPSKSHHRERVCVCSLVIEFRKRGP